MKTLFHKKSTILLFIAIFLCSAAFAEEPVHITALKGPTAMGLVQMMEEKAQDYSFAIEGSVDAITPKLVKQETDFAAIPANLAAVLYQKTNGAIQVVAINTLGVLYLVEDGEQIHSFSNLRGKTICASGKGATPEYALNYLLMENGLVPGQDVTIEWKSEHSECLASLLAGSSTAALLPQPFVTSAQQQQSTIRIALDLNEEWNRLPSVTENGSCLITGVMVVRTAFAEQHPETVRRFLRDYRDSAAFVNQETRKAARLIGKYNIIPEAVAEKALPYCAITCIEGEALQTALDGYLQVLYAQNPQAVGGQLPDEAFYFKP